MDWSPLAISIQTSLTATGCALLLGLLASGKVVRLRGRSRALLDGAFTLPMVVPPTVLGFALLLLLGRNSPLGRFLLFFGFPVVFTRAGAVIAATVVAFPLAYRSLRSALEQVDPDVLAAARTLGMSELRVFWLVRLPMAAPGAAGGAVLAFSRALGEFGATLMLAGNVPGKTQTIPMAIFFAAEGGDGRTALAWVGVVCVLSFISVAALNALSRGRP